MTSIEVLSIPNGDMHESFDSSEFSLIPEQTETETAMAYSNHSQLTSVFQSVCQDLSMEEVQKRLVELMTDNESMKDALRRNNTMMTEQLKTITEWHTQMTTSMSQQQINLTEAKAKLNSLEKENSELRCKMTVMQAESKIIKDSETCTNDAETTMFNDDFEFVSAKKFNEEDLSNKLKEASDVITQLNGKLEKQTLMISELQKSVEEKEKNLFLKEENQVLQQKCDNLLKQIKDSDDERVRTKITYEATQLQLQNKIDELQKELLKAHQETEREKKLYNELKTANGLLQTNNTENLEVLTKNLNEEDLKRKKILEQVDKLTATNFDLEQKLDKRVNDMRKLNEELLTAQMEAEVIPVLKAQVEEYKAELDNAILAKESAREEVERLKTLNAATQAAAVSFCSHCGAGNATSGSATTESEQNSTDAPSRGLIANYNCPLCGFGFDNLQAAENHVNSCLDNSEVVI